MNAAALLVEITKAFQSEPRPGEFELLANNSGYDLEANGIRDSFKHYAWQSLPDELMRGEQGGYIFLSSKGLRYYLPAYLQFCVRDYVAADAIPDGLILIMTLPAEVDVLSSALAARRWPHDDSERQNEYRYLQNRLRTLNQEAHRFINRWSQFSFAQSRAILLFLEYLRDEHSQDYWNNEPDIAIERYWFQFAQNSPVLINQSNFGFLTDTIS